MALTDDQVDELKARNAKNRETIEDLKRQYAEAEAATNNDIRAAALDKEAAAQEAEIARLQAAVSSINGGADVPTQRPENNQFSPTNFSSPAHNVAGEADEN